MAGKNFTPMLWSIWSIAILALLILVYFGWAVTSPYYDGFLLVFLYWICVMFVFTGILSSAIYSNSILLYLGSMTMFVWLVYRIFDLHDTWREVLNGVFGVSIYLLICAAPLFIATFVRKKIPWKFQGNWFLFR